jgi:YD repeat-containing protein
MDSGDGVVTLTDPQGLYTRHNAYDAQGDQTASSTPAIATTLNGVTTTAPATTTQGYDGDGNQTSVVSANGNTTTSAYDHLGRPISTTLPPVKLYDNTTTTPVETTGYDGDGNTVRTTDALGAVTTSSYDPLGRQVATTNPVSGTMLMTYTATELAAPQDMAGNVSRDAYDGAGRLILASDPATGTVGYGYDAVGNTVAITAGDTSGAITQQETRGYDAWDHAITDTVGGPGSPALTTLTAYDLDGNVAQTEQPNGNTTYNSYDLADQLTEGLIYPHPVGAPGANDAAYSAYGYDAAGNVVVSIDADGRSTATTRDGDNRTVQDTSVTGDGATVITTTMGYDPDGNTLRQTQQTQGPTGPAQTHTITNTYNAADWEMSTTNDGLLTRYGYDAAGQQRSHTIVDGTTPVTSTLDAAGRTTSIAEGLGGSGPYTSTYGYNRNDLPISATMPGAVQEQVGYDSNSRPRQLE